MRIMIKGGVWKNTEDEILKAAVMKYGLNQWARISSLLVRKSAKQCKARWYEWLDPSIKKTEWTREEDEKLLHLAKLMPCQWRTIAPIVGRTPAQCLDRYERLLDMAVSKEDRYDPTDDPRRLRPGEIDPNPESKPARPDAVDMDEDEKEMLSEARARLANTRGKKAKRKAREKQLEEARRLAMLQKKRELKAAGIEMRARDRHRGINYSAEVAFEKKPTAGFFDTAAEEEVTRDMQQEFRPVTVEELEGKRRKDIEEALIKRDIKRQKMQESHNAPDALAKAAELNDPVMVRRRGRMMLPAPQITETELEQIARMSTDALVDADVADGAGGDATRQLLGQYGPTPLRPSATPAVGGASRTAAAGDRIMMEAQNLARLNAMETPLLGGDNPELHPSDFSGVTPRGAVAATPNPLLAAATPYLGATTGATPSMTVQRRGSGSIAGVAATPSLLGATPGRDGSMRPGATPMATPMRDELGLNDMDALIVAGSKRAEQQRQAAMRSELRAGLGSLPAPQNEYQIEMPELPEDEAEGQQLQEEDAADAKARRQREEEARRQEEERRKSKALQRHLPRPAATEHLAPPARSAAEQSKLSVRERAEELLAQELVLLLQHDAAKYPVVREKEGKKKDKGSGRTAQAEVPDILVFEDSELQQAAELFESEISFVMQAMGHASVTPESYFDTFSQVRKDLIWVPSKSKYERAASATPTERVESLKSEYDNLRSEMEREAKRAAKLEQKVNILLGGLQQRHSKLRPQLEDLWGQLQTAQMELACFQALKERELRTAPERLEKAQELVQKQQERERDLQDRYKALTRERDEVLRALRAAA
mmetsp:Transcript_23430/g.51433  ORF Transcript_23430/g.51433 Transcript_23430/m.51433 type:complete len:829 (+) Transcript_23430:239-2725(+)|eukprot:CAMPEP_0202891602 /NCGR_PEP_ID=MMETSP1392-20130828/1618_1 /ASSEMBLY_ACC=CAM_ASM_000868 /TAXON_ID=225041 /ORGANISM="Chlamydomonas chlamydogama, Strain SAG 11-48b" /LENGTH=828 /DNA_ID=CAMNT_0049575401 /DNA_START=187 /DNA_END=2673 /DNA_ORIENTATION=+